MLTFAPCQKETTAHAMRYTTEDFRLNNHCAAWLLMLVNAVILIQDGKGQ
jgi:hypothetical protein